MIDQAPELLAYIRDWARIIYDATGDQTKVNRAIELADLNGLFDPVKFALTRPPSDGLVAQVREMAAYLCALEDAEMYKPIPAQLIERGRMYIRAGLTEKHSGDCTNECHSCVVCATESYLLHAKQILDALTAERPSDAEPQRPIWTHVKACKKCGGEGWLWAHELDEYPGQATGCPDDTKYACDDPCHKHPSERPVAQVREALAHAYLMGRGFDSCKIDDVKNGDFPDWHEAVRRTFALTAERPVAQVREADAIVDEQLFLRALVDWVYLHATEGEQWPSTNVADALITAAHRGPPTQANANAYKTVALTERRRKT